MALLDNGIRRGPWRVSLSLCMLCTGALCIILLHARTDCISRSRALEYLPQLMMMMMQCGFYPPFGMFYSINLILGKVSLCPSLLNVSRLVWHDGVLSIYLPL